MVIVLGSFRLSFRGLRSSWHLGLLEANQQPRLRRVGAKVHDGNWKNFLVRTINVKGDRPIQNQLDGRTLRHLPASRQRTLELPPRLELAA